MEFPFKSKKKNQVCLLQITLPILYTLTLDNAYKCSGKTDCSGSISTAFNKLGQI